MDPRRKSVGVSIATLVDGTKIKDSGETCDLKYRRVKEPLTPSSRFIKVPRVFERMNLSREKGGRRRQVKVKCDKRGVSSKLSFSARLNLVVEGTIPRRLGSQEALNLKKRSRALEDREC